MLQYAAPNAPQTFSQSSVFADPASRSASTASQSFESHPSGYSNPRPPSKLSESNNSENRHSRSFGGLRDSDSSTALSQLASLAAQAPAAATNPTPSSSSDRYVRTRRGDWRDISASFSKTCGEAIAQTSLREVSFACSLLRLYNKNCHRKPSPYILKYLASALLMQWLSDVPNYA